ncbi:MAG: AAA family ATPase [Methylotenera sp.]
MEEAAPSKAVSRTYASRRHLSYAWLANAWRNIYSICEECRPKEAYYFPVIKRRAPLPNLDEIQIYTNEPTGDWPGRIKEKPVLLDPCDERDFRAHFNIDAKGQLQGKTDRGRATIKNFSLNRKELVVDRGQAFERYIARLTAPTAPTSDPEIFDFHSMPYGGTWYLLLVRIAKRLDARASTNPALTMGVIRRYYTSQMTRSGFERRVRAALDQVEDVITVASLPSEKSDVSAAKIRVPLITSEVSVKRGTLRPESFKISNFKAIEELEILLPVESQIKSDRTGSALAPALAILGENAAGKSSILEAIAWAMSDTKTRGTVEESVTQDQLLLNPKYLGRPDLGLRKATIEAVFEDKKRLVTKISERETSTTSNVEERVPVFAYGAFRLYLKSDEERLTRSYIHSLFDPGCILPNPERWLASLKGTPAFSEVARALRSVLAIDQEFDVIEVDKSGQCALVIKTNRVGQEPITIRTPLSIVSSGFRSVLAMICDVMRGLLGTEDEKGSSLTNARALVLVDEIEAHLHPRWKLRIMRGLREALPNVTFIVTTHDPLCLRGLAGNEVMVLRRIQQDVRPGSEDLPYVVDPLFKIPSIDALTIEQLLTSDLFQLFSTDSNRVEASLAKVGDELAVAESEPSDKKQKIDGIRAEINRDISKNLPVGSTEVERIIQEAIELYLQKHRHARATELKKLRKDTLDSIVEALGRL